MSVAFEELLKAPDATLCRAAQHLGLTIESRSPALPRPAGSVLSFRLARLPGGHPESTAILAPDAVSPPRKWRDVFSRQDARFFEEATDGLLADLGYVHSSDWWDELSTRAPRL